MSDRSRIVLVTGAAGFIGSHVCERLLADGRDVVGLDNFCDFYDPVVKRCNAAMLALRPGFTLVEGDIRDRGVLERAMERYAPGVVIHLAAMAGVRPSIQNPALYNDVNVAGTAAVLDAAVAHGVERFIFASSSSVYGNAARVPFREDDPVDSPVSPYAATKIAGEKLCAQARSRNGLQVTCLRLFTVFGPRQRPDLAIYRFLQAVSAGLEIKLFGDGGTSRDYTFVGDIADGICASVDLAGHCDVINLGGAHPVTLAELVKTVEAVVGRAAVVAHLPMQAGDVERTWADISRAGEMLGFQPAVELKEGIRRQWEWMRSLQSGGCISGQ